MGLFCNIFKGKLICEAPETRWAVSTVMTRQNNLQLSNSDTTAFIPLWDMCNHENGKITTDFNPESQQGQCYALRDFKKDDQIFIFYGARPNSDLFLHNGDVRYLNLLILIEDLEPLTRAHCRLSTAIVVDLLTTSKTTARSEGFNLTRVKNS
ncbi:Histone-lysine N-methyltransferase setd3 [Eumeta japonica]|uniref:Histone-lysine N-methyltransferase setd3 n=1 Tax=Eumeta variegata TaxID=151549 RepID=A0A4C1YBX7_EUMVA|nr:Histone-lysine N-methyltransferase setd3 [Eumeta japonica]